MTQQWPRYKWRIILSAIAALFHLCTVVIVLILTGGNGEGQAGLVLILDFPLSLFVLGVPQVGSMLSEPISYILFFSIFGTAMYAGGGYIAGYFLDCHKNMPSV